MRFGLLRKPGRGRYRIRLAVRQVRGPDKKGAFAHAIASLAPHPGAVPGEVFDVPSVLQVPGVSEESNAGNLVLKTRVEPADGVVHDGSALGVAAGNDHAAALGFVERRDAFADGPGICAGRADVRGYRCRVEDGKSPHSRQSGSQGGLKLRPDNRPLSD